MCHRISASWGEFGDCKSVRTSKRSNVTASGSCAEAGNWCGRYFDHEEGEDHDDGPCCEGLMCHRISASWGEFGDCKSVRTSKRSNVTASGSCAEAGNWCGRYFDHEEGE